jgi:hypothetical protein
MNGFRINYSLEKDVSITRNDWECIGRLNVITDEIGRVLGLTQSLEGTRGDRQTFAPLEKGRN